MFHSDFINNNALVFNRGATGVDKGDFDKKFSLAKTLTNIRNTSDATTHSSNAQLQFGLKDIGFMILNPER
jgi:hypothetical protein